MLHLVREKEHYFSAAQLFTKSRDGKDPQWLIQLREKAGEDYLRIDFPTTHDEEWKYTNIAPILKIPYRQGFELDLENVSPDSIIPFRFEESSGSQLVFVNGLFVRELSNLSNLPRGMTVGNIAEVAGAENRIMRDHLGIYADYRDHAFTALNTAMTGNGAFIYVPKGKVVETPIHVLVISQGDEPVASHPRVLVVADEGSILTLIESYFSLDDQVYFTNAVAEVFAGRGSVITHYRVQEESVHAFHIATTQVFQEGDSNYTSYAISLGGGISRHDLNVVLNGEHIETTIDGLYVVDGKQHVDNHTAIDHLHPHCRSQQLYKGILDGKARAVFNGKVFVREGALLTDAHQLNKNLLLSSEATVNTKPQLEIFADDVKCAHGATVGQLEDEELFYLTSRGIPPERARSLLTYGFAEDVISRIKLKSVRDRLDRKVLDKLHQSLEVS
ncbi:MAG: Fe-S cluster assembly protein SufD [Acidobacteria bacterium]|nr:Fe-S cluster assembly protein SufD [Acidobacteriota bacterium]